MYLKKRQFNKRSLAKSLSFIEENFGSLERVCFYRGELVVHCSKVEFLKPLLEWLGGRIHQPSEKGSSRWYIRKSCPSFAPLLVALLEKGWLGPPGVNMKLLASPSPSSSDSDRGPAGHPGSQ